MARHTYNRLDFTKGLGVDFGAHTRTELSLFLRKAMFVEWRKSYFELLKRGEH